MKNLYDTIEQNLKAGLQVVVKDLEDNTYCTISNSKDSYGNYIMSGWCNSIEEAKQYIGNYYGHPKEYWDDLDLEIVEVFRREYEPFKVGDEVRILESIRKIENWKRYEKVFYNMKGKIRSAYTGLDRLGYGVYNEDNSTWIYIGHEYLAPLVEEQEEDVALEAIKLLEEKGYRIIKK